MLAQLERHSTSLYAKKQGKIICAILVCLAKHPDRTRACVKTHASKLKRDGFPEANLAI